MEYEEFRRKASKVYAYTGWLTVSEAKESGLIPKEYHELFEDRCECGSVNVIAPNLRREMCCDPKCPTKSAYALAEMFSRYGIQDLGPARCGTIYKALRNVDFSRKSRGEKGLFLYNNYAEVLLVPWAQYPYDVRDVYGQTFAAGCVKIRETPVTFQQLVANLGIPSIHNNTDKIFNGINSAKELSDKAKEYGGLKSFLVSRGVHSPEVIYNLLSNIDTIAIAEYACRALKQSGLLKISVCMTGRVVCDGKSMTKSNFINKCNDLCVDSDGCQMIEIKNTSAMESVPFILYSTRSSSAKFRAGVNRGTVVDNLGKHEVLITVTQFYKILERAMNAWNKQKDIPEEEKISMMSLLKKQVDQTNLKEAQGF